MTLFAGPEAADYVKSVDFITVDYWVLYGEFFGRDCHLWVCGSLSCPVHGVVVPRELHTFPLTDEADMRKSTIISMFHNQLWENVDGISNAS